MLTLFIVPVKPLSIVRMPFNEGIIVTFLFVGVSVTVSVADKALAVMSMFSILPELGDNVKDPAPVGAIEIFDPEPIKFTLPVAVMLLKFPSPVNTGSVICKVKLILPVISLTVKLSGAVAGTVNTTNPEFLF